MRLIGQLRTQDRAQRRTIDGPATLRHDDRRPIDVVIDDLSSTGFLMTTNTALSIGDEISVGIAGIARHDAIVVRRTEFGYGCMLLHPLSDALVRQAELHATFTIAALGFAAPERVPTTDGDRYPLDIRLLVILLAISLPWLVIAVVWLIAF